MKVLILLLAALPICLANAPKVHTHDIKHDDKRHLKDAAENLLIKEAMLAKERGLKGVPDHHVPVIQGTKPKDVPIILHSTDKAKNNKDVQKLKKKQRRKEQKVRKKLNRLQRKKDRNAKRKNRKLKRKGMNNAKKQARALVRGKQKKKQLPASLHEIIEEILAKHKDSTGSKLSKDSIKQHLTGLLQKSTKQNDCSKKGRKLKKSRKTPRMLSVRKRKRPGYKRKNARKWLSFRGRQRVRVNNRKPVVTKVSRKFTSPDGKTHTYVTKGKDGKVKSTMKVTVKRKRPFRRRNIKARRNGADKKKN